MPWSTLDSPSIQLGTLKSVLRKSNFRVEVRLFNLAFMNHLLLFGSQPLVRVEDYTDVAEKYFHLGMGDWIFSVPPFRDSNETDDARYLEQFVSKSGDKEFVSKALQMREQVPKFLEQCCEETLSLTPRVVGFTTTFCQNVPALVLSKLLKSREPSLKIVFGGSNCDGPMGDALHRAFPWVDVVVRGEGERVLPMLVQDLFAGGDIRPSPGLCYRSGAERVVIDDQRNELVAMEEVPLPDYDDYFERLEETSFHAELSSQISIPFESARGCWWGAKKHCTFCGLNGPTMAFRSKDPTVVLEEVTELSRRYGQLSFYAVDNIIDMSYFSELLPRLRDLDYDFKFFYETKSNLKLEQLRAMRDAGVLSIQPGIESLSTPILRSMEKGVTALQNIRFLKWCAEFGIEPGWNFLYGFPREPAEEYSRMAGIIPALTFLSPPQSLSPLHLERFSPYHQRSGEYGLTIKGPKSLAYSTLIYPTDAETLSELAYSFDYKHQDGRDPETYIGPLRESINVWRTQYREGSNLSYRRGPGFLIIKDRRPDFGGFDYSLEQTEAAIYLSCDAGATPKMAWKSLDEETRCQIEVEEVEDFLKEMTELKLMYEEDGCYVSLAVAENRRSERTVVETAEVSLATGLVQLKRTNGLSLDVH
jgi:ribosomal peptide maturation radical SAM protein 1